MKSFPLSTAVEKAVLKAYEDISTPLSLGASLLLRNGEWDQLTSLRVDPKAYTDAHTYWLDATVCSLFRKTVDAPTSIDRKAVAVEGFWSCERECLRTNARLYEHLEEVLSGTPLRSRISDFFLRARKIVADILGPVPAVFDGRFGPGATYGDRGALTTVPDKMTSSPTLTRGAWPWLIDFTGTAWATACANAVPRRDPLFVRGNRFTTVPKDCSKDRGIAVEPSINLFYQLGVGRRIRSRLFRAGIDLTHGQEIHRRVACEASIDGHLATIDLKNASDTVSRNLVELLIPRDWFALLDSLRSPTTLVEGKTVLLEKFSSMGNGFTFELETLIFLGLCLASIPGSLPGVDVYVYGDDIIIPTDAYSDVVAALNYAGLTVNREKSFHTGQFRESCGGDYFGGKDVRPYFLKEFPREPQHFIRFANGIRHQIDMDPTRSHLLRRFWFGLQDCIPTAIRACRGPKALGDLVLHDDEEKWNMRTRSSRRHFRCYRPARSRKVSWNHWRPDVVLASALYTSWDEIGGVTPSQGVTPRDPILGYKVGWVTYS